jgi:hypothetical protein
VEKNQNKRTEKKFGVRGKSYHGGQDLSLQAIKDPALTRWQYVQAKSPYKFCYLQYYYFLLATIGVIFIPKPYFIIFY